MRKIVLIGLVLVFVGCTKGTSAPKPIISHDTNQATYTISGVKDKRLDAFYKATYISQNLEDEECFYQRQTTGGKRPIMMNKGIKVKDGNYSIDFPIVLNEDERQCNFKFTSLMLIMKRKYDKELSSIHYILSDKQEVSPIYWKTKRGAKGSGSNPETPPFLGTDKQYFRIAKDSKFLCKTLWFAEHGKGRLHMKEHSQFHCTMQINSDVNRTLYKRNMKTYAYHHPEFGVDEIEDTHMSIDILVDEKNCKAIIDEQKVDDHFRELEEPSIWQKLF